MAMLVMQTNDLSALELEVERLQQSNDWLSDSFAFAGHEIRNALLRLKLMTAKLERSSHLSADEEETLKRISASTRTLENVALNCLRLAQVDSQSLVLNPTRVDLIEEIVNPLFRDYAETFSEYGLNVSVQAPSNLARLDVDLDLMWLVLSNLIGNAVKYGEVGGSIRIEIAQNISLTEISVWNSGIGISAPLLNRIFDRFVTGNHHSTYSTGIGLYLVKRIIDTHRGTVRCESAHREWARFIIELPRQSLKLHTY